MKKTLLTMAMAFMAFMVQAQETKTWTFEGPDWYNVETGNRDFDYGVPVTVDGLTVYPKAKDTKTRIQPSNKKIAGKSYTHCLSLQGAAGFPKNADPTAAVKFSVTGDCSIYVAAVHGKTSETTTRPLYITTVARSTDPTIGQIDLVGGGDAAAKGETFTYTGEATDIYIFSAANGINIYEISVTTKNVSSAIENVKAEAQPAKSAVAYDLMGRPVTDSYKGIVISNGKKSVR